MSTNLCLTSVIHLVHSMVFYLDCTHTTTSKMIEVKINEERHRVPTSWSDFTVGHIQTIFAEMQENAALWNSDFLFRFSHYTGINYNELLEAEFSESQIYNLKQFVEFENVSITEYIPPAQNSLQFYKEDGAGDWCIRVPKEYSAFNEREIKTPLNIQERQLGCRIMFEQIVFPEYQRTGNIISTLHFAIAIYFQPLYYLHRFDTDQMMQLAEIAKRCKFVDAFPIGNFFLKKWQQSSKKNQRSSTNRPIKKYVQA